MDVRTGRAHRATIGLPKKLSLTLGWAPPVEVGGVEPNLVTVALGRPFARAGAWRFGWRLYAQTGSVEGDFTCDADTAAAGNDSERNPFGCLEPSNESLQISQRTADCFADEFGCRVFRCRYRRPGRDLRLRVGCQNRRAR